MAGYFGHAPIITVVTPTDTNGTDVFSGVPMRVLGFTVANINAGSVVTATIRTNESSPTTLWTASFPLALGGVGTRAVVNIPFIADKGLEVVSSIADSVTFTFLHTQTGS